MLTKLYDEVIKQMSAQRFVSQKDPKRRQQCIAKSAAYLIHLKSTLDLNMKFLGT